MGEQATEKTTAGTGDEITRGTTSIPSTAPGAGPRSAWPSPPPRTVEHAVALLATTWTRARGAA